MVCDFNQKKGCQYIRKGLSDSTFIIKKKKNIFFICI